MHSQITVIQIDSTLAYIRLLWDVIVSQSHVFFTSTNGSCHTLSAIEEC